VPKKENPNLPDDRALQFVRAALNAAPGPSGRFDYERVAWLIAASSSAEYLQQHLLGAQNCITRTDLLDFTITKCAVEGLMLEFGVYKGKSLEMIAGLSGREVHGFDSFEGLPEDWTYLQKKGRFSLKGDLPQFDNPKIRLHKGLFEESLPPFLAEHAEPARFVHIDCDLYSSALTVLKLLTPRLVAGTIIVFDEYLNYPGWQFHEYKAFQEFIAETKMSYRYIAYASDYFAVAVEFV
jgi:hypothetical protein